MNPAEQSTVTPADAARSGNDRPHSQSRTDLSAALDATEADRYALAFRPSWAPLGQEPQPAAAVKPGSLAPALQDREDREDREDRRSPEPHEPPLRVPVRGARRRAGLLASASVLSFFGLVYWGVSSTTHPAAPARVVQIGTPPSAAQPVDQPSQLDQLEQSAQPAGDSTASSDLSALRASPSAAAEPSRARLAEDPDPTAATVSEPAPPAAAEDSLVARAPDAPQPVAEAASEPVASAQPLAPVPAPKPPVTQPPVTQPPVTQPPVTQQPPVTTGSASATPPLAAAPRPALVAGRQEPIATATHAQPAPAPQRQRMPLLSVRALPEGAQLFLDGQRLPNPFDMRLPEGGKHKLEARSEGYEASTQTLRIEADARLTIALRRTAPVPEPQLQVRPLGQQPAQHTQGAGFVTSNPY